jgi:2-amino-4-hydroxy-6-hydroxymethyldihydropteridine diphosphokinase
MTQSIVFLGLGSNIGDRVKALKEAERLISEIDGVLVVSSASLYETEPVGIVDQPSFINSALKIKTTLRPTELLGGLKEIERKLGRVDTIRWGPRIIDIDILLFDNIVVNKKGLTIPHPEMAKRAFVLVPLSEIAPNVIHPVLKKSVRELVDDLGDAKGIIKYQKDRCKV